MTFSLSNSFAEVGCFKIGRFLKRSQYKFILKSHSLVSCPNNISECGILRIFFFYSFFFSFL